MTWNYRVVKTGEGFGVFEVYYDEAGRAIGTTENPILGFFCETPEAILAELEVMKAAWELPYLEMDSIGSGAL